MLSKSKDWQNFENPIELARSNGSGFDGSHMWSPDIIINGKETKIYYAGNLG